MGGRQRVVARADGFCCDTERTVAQSFYFPLCGCLWSDDLTDLSGKRSPAHVLDSDGLFDSVHLLLVAPAVPPGALLGLLQGVFQGFDSLSCHSQTFLQLGKLAAEVCVVPDQLRATGKGHHVH